MTLLGSRFNQHQKQTVATRPTAAKSFSPSLSERVAIRRRSAAEHAFDEIAPTVSHTVERAGPRAPGARGQRQPDFSTCRMPEITRRSQRQIYCTMILAIPLDCSQRAAGPAGRHEGIMDVGVSPAHNHAYVSCRVAADISSDDPPGQFLRELKRESNSPVLRECMPCRIRAIARPDIVGSACGRWGVGRTPRFHNRRPSERSGREDLHSPFGAPSAGNRLRCPRSIPELAPYLIRPSERTHERGGCGAASPTAGLC